MAHTSFVLLRRVAAQQLNIEHRKNQLTQNAILAYRGVARKPAYQNLLYALCMHTPSPDGLDSDRASIIGAGLPVFWVALLTALGYFFAAYVVVNYALTPEGIAIVWPPNGVLLAALLLRPQREWVWYLAAIIPAELIADYPHFTVLQALAFALINAGEALLAALLLRGRRGPPFTLSSLRDTMRFGLWAVGLASMAAAVLGAWVHVSISTGPTTYWTFWQIWWFGDALGLLLVTPFIIGWVVRKSRLLPINSPQRILEAIALVVATCAMGLIVYGGFIDRSHVPVSAILTLPLPIWAGVRFGLRGAASITMLITAFAIAEATRGDSLFRVFNELTVAILLQEYVATLAFSSLVLATLLRELRERSATLEQRVNERTRELIETNARLETLATTDALTGLFNRGYFMRRAVKTFAQSNRHQSNMSVVMLDVDHFKHINDTWGHDFGDTVLQRIANTCKQALREADIAARYGGEEFVLMLPDTPASDAEITAERIRRAIADLQLTCNGEIIPVSASLGVAERMPEDVDIRALLIRADTALYIAKKSGRNRVVCAEGVVNSEITSQV